MYQVPDRITGLKEVDELRRLCPGRTWNFVSYHFVMAHVLNSSIQVEIDVSYEVSYTVKYYICTPIIIYLGVSECTSFGRRTYDTRTNCYGSCQLFFFPNLLRLHRSLELSTRLVFCIKRKRTTTSNPRCNAYSVHK